MPTFGLRHKVPIIILPSDVNYYCQLSIFEKSAKIKSTEFKEPFELKLALNGLRLDNELLFQQSDNQGLLDSIGSYHYVQIETNRIY